MFIDWLLLESDNSLNDIFDYVTTNHGENGITKIHIAAKSK